MEDKLKPLSLSLGLFWPKCYSLPSLARSLSLPLRAGFRWLCITWKQNHWIPWPITCCRSNLIFSFRINIEYCVCCKSLLTPSLYSYLYHLFIFLPYFIRPLKIICWRYAMGPFDRTRRNLRTSEDSSQRHQSHLGEALWRKPWAEMAKTDKPRWDHARQRHLGRTAYSKGHMAKPRGLHQDGFGMQTASRAASAWRALSPYARPNLLAH